MKRWAALTVLLYVVTLIALTLPIVMVAFGKWWIKENQGIAWHEAIQWFLEWGYWVWLAVMGLAQALLLLAPVGIAQRRLAPRRPLLAPVITTGFFLANIFLGAALALLCAIFKDKAFDAFAVVGALARTDSPQNPLTDQISKSAPSGALPPDSRSCFCALVRACFSFLPNAVAACARRNPQRCKAIEPWAVLPAGAAATVAPSAEQKLTPSRRGANVLHDGFDRSPFG